MASSAEQRFSRYSFMMSRAIGAPDYNNLLYFIKYCYNMLRKYIKLYIYLMAQVSFMMTAAQILTPVQSGIFIELSGRKFKDTSYAGGN